MKQTSKSITFAGILIVFALSGCYSSSSIRAGSDNDNIIRTAESVPGVVNYIWEEPMVDVTDVPPGLDPEGQYWRPGHAQIVEIRQGKWKHYRFPDQEK